MSVAQSNLRATLSNVSWRGAILIAPEKIIPIKIVNISADEILLLSSYLLKDGQSYQMMLEVPDPNDASRRTQVVCNGMVKYAILSGSDYRAGVRYSGVHAEHLSLLAHWSH
jgi:hypothetical protein